MRRRRATSKCLPTGTNWLAENYDAVCAFGKFITQARPETSSQYNRKQWLWFIGTTNNNKAEENRMSIGRSSGYS